jgi:hypothetical protein
MVHIFGPVVYRSGHVPFTDESGVRFPVGLQVITSVILFKNTNMKNKYSENWKDSWDPEDWQGRSKKQVDYFHLIVGISLTVMVLYLLTEIIF